MKILVIHNKYLIGGGEDVSTQAEVDLLRKYGHDVDLLLLNNESIENVPKWKVALDSVWSRDSYKLVLNKIQEEKYDIVHVQNFFPLFSPSIFYACKKAGAKVVMSVRNYRLVCPNALLFVNDEVCSKCVGRKIPVPGIVNKCYKDSYATSLVVAAMLSYHNLIGTWNKKIDAFICISSFVKEQLIKGGIQPDKLYKKFNFIGNDPGFNEAPDNYYLYVGRLSSEKGITLLLEAFAEKALAGIKLVIIGDGPLKQQVLSAAEKHSNIEYRGKLSLDITYSAMKQARYLVFPSRWHEPFGRTIVESFACGTPVIASNTGGAIELVQNNYNGLLFERDDVESLKSIILQSNTLDTYSRLRLNARDSYLNNFTAEDSYKRIMDIYQTVLNSNL